LNNLYRGNLQSKLPVILQLIKKKGPNNLRFININELKFKKYPNEYISLSMFMFNLERLLLYYIALQI